MREISRRVYRSSLRFKVKMFRECGFFDFRVCELLFEKS